VTVFTPKRALRASKMYLVAIAWLYVAMMMAVAEATSPIGSLLGAFFTFALYGLAPVALLMYLLGTPNRLRARKLAETSALAPAVDPDRGSEPPAGTEDGPVAPVRKEP
jgi:hypothetical protein